MQIDNISESGRDEETVMSSSTPPASQIAQFLKLSTEVEDFGLVSGAGMEFGRASDLLVSISVGTEETKQKIADLSFAALKELQTMAKEKHPLWQECVDGEILSHLEYTKQFWQMDKTVLEKVMRKTKEIPLLPNLSSSRCISVSHQESLAPLRSEASRHTEFFPVIPVHIVELLMDMVLFPSQLLIEYFMIIKLELRTNFWFPFVLKIRTNTQLCFLILSQEPWYWPTCQQKPQGTMMELCKW